MSTDVTAKTPAPAPPGKGGAATGDGLLQLVLDGMRRNMRQYGMLIALGLIVALFAVWTDGDLLLPRNVSNLVLQNSYILILAIGMMIVIISGHIDLSVGSLTAFIGSIAAVFMVRNDIPWPMAVVLCLLVGAVAGAAQGFMIAYFGIPSFIVTLAGMLIFAGGNQFLGAADCDPPAPPADPFGTTLTIPGGHHVTALLITGEANIQVTSAAIGGGQLPLLNFQTTQQNPNEVLSLDNGLELTDNLILTCTSGTGQFAAIGQDISG